MAVTQENAGALNTLLKVQLKKEDFEKKVSDTIKKVAKQTAIKGFRPGMAPMGLVKKMYGTSVLAEEVQKLLNDQVFSYIRENNLDVLGQPLPAANQNQLALDINNIKDLEFTYEIGLAPSVHFSFLDAKPTVAKYKVRIEDKMLDEEVDRLRKRFAKYEYPEDVQENDILSFTIEELDSIGNVKEGGVSNVTSIMPDMFKESYRAPVMALQKHKSFVTNLWESIDRVKEDVAKHLLNISEPEQLAAVGKNFKLTLNNITRSLPADVDAEFLQKVYGGNGGPSNEAEMREQITKDLEDYFSGQTESVLTNELYKLLLEKTELPLPDEFLKRMIKVTNEKEITEEQIAAEYPLFSKQIRWTLIVKKIINEQNLSVSDFELREKVKVDTIAQMYSYGLRNIGDEWVDQFIEKQMQDAEYIKRTREQILDNKALEYVKTRVTLDEKLINFEEFKALVERKD